MVLSGNKIYGTAAYGGIYEGTVFAVNTDGTGYTNLHEFTHYSVSDYVNSDGAQPYSGLILSGSILYGTANIGGPSGAGTVFKVNTDGSGFTVLYSFSHGSLYDANNDGAFPYGLVLSGNTLYGITAGGGVTSNGTVFAVNTDGTGFQNLHNFTGNLNGHETNSDGANPRGWLVLSSNVLYGTTGNGGTSAGGSIFRLNIDGTGFTNLHNFSVAGGFGPTDGLILSGDTLYGTTYNGGSFGSGVVFAINNDGTGFRVVHSFTDVTYSGDAYSNNDGRAPLGGLCLVDNVLYGTTEAGGSEDVGTVFAVNTDGTGFTTLHNFTGQDDGDRPFAGIIGASGTFYGTTEGYNVNAPFDGYGTLFRLSPAPTLNMSISNSSVILSWPTNLAGIDYAGFTLQSATDLSAPVWSNVSPPTAPVNGQYVVTNGRAGTQMFYRLIR